LFCLIGLSAACALLAGAILYLFAPDVAPRFLKSAGTTVLAVLFALVALDQLIRAVNSFALLLGAALACTLAYLVREHRLGHPVRRDGFRHAERTPVLPQYIPDEDRK
jgi:uncharacterized membrane protein YccC